MKLCDYTALKNNIAVSTTLVFIDPRNHGYYELNAIDLENIFMIGKIIHVKKRADLFLIEWNLHLTRSGKGSPFKT